MADDSYRPVIEPELPCHADGNQSLILHAMRPLPDHELVELVLDIQASRSELGRYLYSKLYYSTHPDIPFCEDAVVCFEVSERGSPQRVQVALPEAAWSAARSSGYLRLRLDALPYSRGAWRLDELRLVGADVHPSLTRHARRVAHRQWVREQVMESERLRRVELPHYPESVSIELTAMCNLRCPHCSSHGMPHLHKHHNQMPEMPVQRLYRLAQESFPHIQVVSIVGRGEPTLASDALWDCLTGQLREHDVRLSCVSNGTRVRQRFDAALMPWMHELTFSIDGATAATFEANRLGAQYATMMDSLAHYHEVRSRAPLLRRPQMTISWTLKRNNLNELPGFIEQIAPFDPDLLSIRHMVIFQDKERHQSLLGHQRETNAVLREVYAELDRRGIRHESPPLMLESAADSLPTVARGASPPAEPCKPLVPAVEREAQCNWMHRTAIIMSDGEVTTCGKHYGQPVGHLNEHNTLWDIWNGPAMRSLRDGFGKAHMWEQCKACWLREIKWHSQRQAKDQSRDYCLDAPMDFTEAAWDYRQYAEL